MLEGREHLSPLTGKKIKASRRNMGTPIIQRKKLLGKRPKASGNRVKDHETELGHDIPEKVSKHAMRSVDCVKSSSTVRRGKKREQCTSGLFGGERLFLISARTEGNCRNPTKPGKRVGELLSKKEGGGHRVGEGGGYLNGFASRNSKVDLPQEQQKKRKKKEKTSGKTKKIKPPGLPNPGKDQDVSRIWREMWQKKKIRRTRIRTKRWES